jgi:hypothetical protein
VPIDVLMSRWMLLGIKRRAETVLIHCNVLPAQAQGRRQSVGAHQTTQLGLRVRWQTKNRWDTAGADDTFIHIRPTVCAAAVGRRWGRLHP